MSLRTPLLVAALILAGAAHAQVTIQDPWVRGTVAQQKASGLFAVITSTNGGKLVAGSSPVAGVVEIHEMKMEGSTMKMREVAGGLPLPAGQAVSLQPGGYHVMLMDLKQQLKAGDTVPVTLVIEGADGQRQNVEVQAPVRPLGSAMGGGMGGHKH